MRTRSILAFAALMIITSTGVAQQAQAPLGSDLAGSNPAATQSTGPKSETLRHETVELQQGGPRATVDLLYKPGVVERYAVLLMTGALEEDEPPKWSEGLLDDGFMLAAFRVAHPPDPDPKRRPQWLYFDQRFAHGYILGAKQAPADAGRVIDYLISRGDVHPDKIGWFGVSSTGIPGLAVATQEPRLAAVLGFVTTGSLRQWFETWHTNGLWKGETKELWPETDELLRKHDPILHVDGLFPTAVLLVCGGDDEIVDPSTTRAFVDAARPRYETDASRLRLVIYEDFGHNLPRDTVKMYAEHWFRLYMHPTKPPPRPTESEMNKGQTTPGGTSEGS